MDGVAWSDAVEFAPALESANGDGSATVAGPRPYDDAESRDVAERLRALGYLD